MTDSTEAADTEPAAPVLKITRGSATAEEVAALTVLLSALGGAQQNGEPNLRRGWSRPDRRLNRGVLPGGGWGRH